MQRCRAHAAGLVLLLTLRLLGATTAWDTQPDGYEIIDGPRAHESVSQWRDDWTRWRDMELRANRYDAADACSLYNLPQTQWTQSNLVQAMLMLHDRAIFDRVNNSFTVDAYVTSMQARVGRLDSVLLWPAYPNIGIDNRNQWDFLRTLPGGLEALKSVVQQFQARGIRVLVPYNPWDTATRDEPGFESTVRTYAADIATLNAMLEQTGADGFNGDTMFGVPKSFFNCSAPTVATPEGGVPTAFLSHNPISWGYFFGAQTFPPVARAKFLEPRHMVQLCARWSLDKTLELQTAFFNGAGYVVWENVWGIWNALTDRESETIKRMFSILHKFSFAITSAQWTPYTPLLPQRQAGAESVFASAFPALKQGCWFYTLISTSSQATSRWIELPKSLKLTNATQAFDLYRGLLVPIERQPAKLKVSLEPRGFSAVLITESDDIIQKLQLAEFLTLMQAMTSKPLASYSNARPILQQKIARAQQTGDESDSTDDDRNMRRIRGTSRWWFNVTGVQVEPVLAWTPNWPSYGLGVQFPWESRPWNNHSVRLHVPDFAMDTFPVTNAQFAAFINASDYRPKNLERFLDHWHSRQEPEEGEYRPLEQWIVPDQLRQSPVVHVSREDADTYCSFYGKRLPHDWEWQYVVSNGEDYDRFPWGSDWDADRLPRVSRAKQPPPLEPVGSHEFSKARVFEVEDLVGYVWQMTDQFCDDHTCGLLLRGGSCYQPIAASGSDPNWYFPQALQATQHNRLLMLSQSADRSAFVGFRCVRSLRPRE